MHLVIFGAVLIFSLSWWVSLKKEFDDSKGFLTKTFKKKLVFLGFLTFFSIAFLFWYFYIPSVSKAPRFNPQPEGYSISNNDLPKPRRIVELKERIKTESESSKKENKKALEKFRKLD